MSEGIDTIEQLIELCENSEHVFVDFHGNDKPPVTAVLSTKLIADVIKVIQRIELSQVLYLIALILVPLLCQLFSEYTDKLK